MTWQKWPTEVSILEDKIRDATQDLDLTNSDDRSIFRHRCMDICADVDIHTLISIVKTVELSRQKVMLDIAQHYINEAR